MIDPPESITFVPGVAAGGSSTAAWTYSYRRPVTVLDLLSVSCSDASGREGKPPVWLRS